MITIKIIFLSTLLLSTLAQEAVENVEFTNTTPQSSGSTNFGGRFGGMRGGAANGGMQGMNSRGAGFGGMGGNSGAGFGGINSAGESNSAGNRFGGMMKGFGNMMGGFNNNAKTEGSASQGGFTAGKGGQNGFGGMGGGFGGMGGGFGGMGGSFGGMGGGFNMGSSFGSRGENSASGMGGLGNLLGNMMETFGGNTGSFGNMGGFNRGSGSSSPSKMEALMEFARKRRNQNNGTNQEDEFSTDLMKSLLSHAIQEEIKKDQQSGETTINHNETETEMSQGNFMNLLHGLYDPSNQDPEKHQQITEMLKNSLPEDFKGQFESERKFDISEMMNNQDALNNFTQTLAGHLGSSAKKQNEKGNMFADFVPSSNNQAYNNIINRLSHFYNRSNSTDESAEASPRKSLMNDFMKGFMNSNSSNSSNSTDAAEGVESLLNKFSDASSRKDEIKKMAQKFFDELKGSRGGN